MRKPLTQSRLREVLRYDPLSGLFYWLISTSNRVKIGQVAGTIDKDGYVVIGIDGYLYKGHRLVWLYIHGAWPTAELDHKHVIPSDNRLDELREATRSQNCCNRKIQSNNTSGFKGVSFSAQHGVFYAYVKLNGKKKHLGTYDTAIAASLARELAAKELYREFARS